MVDPSSCILAGGARHDHERDQMVFARMRGTGGRRGRPVQQPLRAFLRSRFDERLIEPSVKRCGRRPSRATHDPVRIMKAESAADDQHALVAQRSDQFADPDVLGRIEVCLHRELHQRQSPTRMR